MLAIHMIKVFRLDKFCAIKRGPKEKGRKPKEQTSLFEEGKATS